MSLVWWAVAGIVAVGCYLWYASIVRRRTRVFEALAGIDVQLQQRHDLIPNETRLGEQMGRLMMLAENYPQLRSDGPMIEAQRTYSEIETNIAAARRFYNASVGSLTNAVATFPGPLLKALAGVSEMPPFFQTVDAARKPVDAGQYL